MKFKILHSCAGTQYVFKKGEVVDSEADQKRAVFVATNLAPYGQAEVIEQEIKLKKSPATQNRKARTKTTRTRKAK